MYIKQALGQIASDQLGKDPGGTSLTFSGTKTGEETKTINDDGDGFFSWGKGVLESGFNFFASGERAKGEAAAYEEMAKNLSAGQRQQTPAWVWPAAIGGGVLALVLIMRRR